MSQSPLPELQEWTTPEGATVCFDGVFYSYRSEDGLRAFKIWTPPQDTPIRALVLFGNPGGGLGGDTRDKAFQQDLLEFAAREQLAVGGVTGFPGREVYARHGHHVLDGLKAMAAHGRHPELADIPFIFTGSSNAAFFAYSMLCLVPERTVAITPNVGGYFDLNAPEAAHAVPAWIHIGTLDPLVTDGVPRSEELFRLNDKGGNLRWTWDAEMKGHATEGSDHVDMAYWKAVLDLRLPINAAGEVDGPLRAVRFEDGWLADFETWDYPITRVFPASERPADAETGRYGWLPNKGIARLYQANASRSRPLRIELVNEDLGQSAEGTTGVLLAAGQSAIVNPGQEVTVRVSRVPLAFGIQQADIYDRDEKLGSVEVSDQPGLFTFKADGNKRLYALYAYTESDNRVRSGGGRISQPLQILVRGPEASARIQAQLAPYSLSTISRARAEDPASRATPERVDLAADALGAVYLEPTTVAKLRPDGKLAGFWRDVPLGNTGPGNTPMTEAVRTRVAWSRAGLHFLFEDVSESVGIDFHLASVDPQTLLAAPSDPAPYTMPGLRQLLRSALQIQPQTDGASVNVNYWDPWDFRSEALMRAADFNGTGLWSDAVEGPDGRRHLELHLPWPMVGHPGFSSVPPVFTQLTFMLNRDGPDGEGRINWPNGMDPWQVKPPSEPAGTSAYGKLILLP